MNRSRMGAEEGGVPPYAVVLGPSAWPGGWLEVYLGELEAAIWATGVRVRCCQGQEDGRFSSRHLRRKVMAKLKRLGFVVAAVLLLLVPAGLKVG